MAYLRPITPTPDHHIQKVIQILAELGFFVFASLPFTQKGEYSL